MKVYLPKFTIEAAVTQQSAPSFKLYPKGILASGFMRAWKDGYTGKGIKVAVIDTGIDANHPDLKGKVIKSINLTGEPLNVSHGTHVAGTIAANGWVVGGAPDASLIDIKVLGQNGGSISNVVKGIQLAVTNGATIINLSIGGSNLKQQDILLLTRTINQAWNSGVLCVAAAGNDGKSICTPDLYSYPASVPRAKSIASCDVGETLDNISLSIFSNENSLVDLAACGQNVISPVIGGTYAIYSGTSMATPHVSAMAAIFAQIIKSKNPRLKGGSFCSALVNMIRSNVMEVPSCHSSPPKTNYWAKPVHNISFGLGFLRYNPTKGPDVNNDEKIYHNGIFLGHQSLN